MRTPTGAQRRLRLPELVLELLQPKLLQPGSRKALSSWQLSPFPCFHQPVGLFLQQLEISVGLLVALPMM